VCGVENLEELLLYYIELSYVLSYIKWSFEKIHSHSLTLKTTTGSVYVSRVFYTATVKNKYVYIFLIILKVDYIINIITFFINILHTRQ